MVNGELETRESWDEGVHSMVEYKDGYLGMELDRADLGRVFPAVGTL